MSANIQKPLLNAFLQGDLRGNGKQITDVVLSDASLADAMDGNAQSITDLGGLAVGYNDTKEIWIGQRTSGKVGSGSKIDPYDASTVVKFDAIMAGLNPSYKWIVNILDGEYETTGSYSYNATDGYYIPPGIKIIGMGPRNTLVRCTYYPVAAGQNGHAVFESSILTDGAGILIEGMTIDCNWQNLDAAADTKMSAVSIAGNDCQIRNVRGINCYGHLASLSESFMLGINCHQVDGVYQICRGALIEDCIAEDFQGDYGVAIAMIGIGFGDGVGSISGKIRGNKVYDWITRTSAYQMGGKGIDLVDNETWNCLISVYMDTGNMDNCLIARNRFMGVLLRGIQLSPSLGTEPWVRHLRIQDNEIEVSDATPISTPVAIGISPVTVNHAVDIIISRNHITKLYTETDMPTNAISVAQSSGVRIEDNTIESTHQNNLFEDEYPNTGLTVLRNLTDTGEVPSGLYERGVLTVAPEASFFGALRTTAVRTTQVPPTYSYWTYDMAFTDYDIEAGDVLQVYVYCTSESAWYSALSFLRDQGTGDTLDANGMVDQNGILGYENLTAFAVGQYYARRFDLTEYAGTTVDAFRFGGGGNNGAGDPATEGLAVYYYKDIRIVDADGMTKRNIFTSDSPGGVITEVIGAIQNVTDNDAGAYYPMNPPLTEPAAAGLLWVDSGASFVTKVSQ